MALQAIKKLLPLRVRKRVVAAALFGSLATVTAFSVADIQQQKAFAVGLCYGQTQGNFHVVDVEESARELEVFVLAQKAEYWPDSSVEVEDVAKACAQELYKRQQSLPGVVFN